MYELNWLPLNICNYNLETVILIWCIEDCHPIVYWSKEGFQLPMNFSGIIILVDWFLWHEWAKRKWELEYNWFAVVQ